MDKIKEFLKLEIDTYVEISKISMYTILFKDKNDLIYQYVEIEKDEQKDEFDDKLYDVTFYKFKHGSWIVTLNFYHWDLEYIVDKINNERSKNE